MKVRLFAFTCIVRVMMSLLFVAGDDSDEGRDNDNDRDDEDGDDVGNADDR